MQSWLSKCASLKKLRQWTKFKKRWCHSAIYIPSSELCRVEFPSLFYNNLVEWIVIIESGWCCVYKAQIQQIGHSYKSSPGLQLQTEWLVLKLLVYCMSAVFCVSLYIVTWHCMLYVSCLLCVTWLPFNECDLTHIWCFGFRVFPHLTLICSCFKSLFTVLYYLHIKYSSVWWSDTLCPR
jgi:hypothetical protein